MKGPAVANTLLGLWLIASPTLLQYGGAAAANDVALGITIVCIAVGSLVLLPQFTWTSWLVLFSGIFTRFRANDPHTTPVARAHRLRDLLADNGVRLFQATGYVAITV